MDSQADDAPRACRGERRWTFWTWSWRSSWNGNKGWRHGAVEPRGGCRRTTGDVRGRSLAASTQNPTPAEPSYSQACSGCASEERRDLCGSAAAPVRRLGLWKTGAGCWHVGREAHSRMGWTTSIISVKTTVFRFLTELTERHMVSTFANLNLTTNWKKLNFSYG
jgi:hypothetical protein